MAPLSTDAWLILAAVAIICVLTFLYALATLYRDQTRLHDLKVRVHDLRREYSERLARQHAEQIMDALPSQAPAARTAPANNAERPRAAA